MSVFDVNFSKLSANLLPTVLRKPLVFAFESANITPIERVWSRFLKQREEAEFLLKYDTGKRNLELALRRRFGDEGIYINNAAKQLGLHVDFYLDDYLHEGGYETAIQTAYIGELFTSFYIDEELPTDDFVIYVPELTYIVKAQAIHDFAGYFVLPGFKYSVQRY